MSEQTKILNSVVATEIINVLSPLKNNVESVIEKIISSQNPYLTVSDVEYINSLSVKSVNALNNLILNPGLGVVKCDYITLFRFNSFNSSNKFYLNTPIYDKSISSNNFDNLNKVPYSALFLQNFIDIDNDRILVPHNYTVNDISFVVIENLTTILEIIDNNIKNYQKF